MNLFCVVKMRKTINYLKDKDMVLTMIHKRNLITSNNKTIITIITRLIMIRRIKAKKTQKRINQTMKRRVRMKKVNSRI
jgi:hypothetical protein